MPAPPLSNTFEGGTDSVAITTGNSGGASGDAFTSVSGALDYSNAHPHTSSMGAKIVDVVSTTWCGWTGLGGLTGDVFLRGYGYLDAYPTGNHLFFFHVRSSADLAGGGLRINSVAGGNKCAAYDAAGSGHADGSIAPSLNSVFRLECRIFPSTTVGEIEWRLYNDPDSLTITDTVQTTGRALRADIDRAYFGSLVAVPTSPFDFYFDDIAVSTVDWIGPSELPPEKQTVFIPRRRMVYR